MRSAVCIDWCSPKALTFYVTSINDVMKKHNRWFDVLIWPFQCFIQNNNQWSQLYFFSFVCFLMTLYCSTFHWHASIFHNQIDFQIPGLLTRGYCFNPFCITNMCFKFFFFFHHLFHRVNMFESNLLED